MKMLRPTINFLVCLLLASCGGKPLKVALVVDKSEIATRHFNSREDAAKWVADACQSLWRGAQDTGKSPDFHIVVSGRDMAGTLESPNYRFQRKGPSFMQLVQIESGNEPSPKIEGEELQWESVNRYLESEVMMNRLLKGL